MWFYFKKNKQHQQKDMNVGYKIGTYFIINLVNKKAEDITSTAFLYCLSNNVCIIGMFF